MILDTSESMIAGDLGQYYLEYIDSMQKLNNFKQQDQYRIQIQSKLSHYINVLQLIENIEKKNAALVKEVADLKEYKRKHRLRKEDSLKAPAVVAPKVSAAIVQPQEVESGSSSYLQKKCNQLSMQLNVVQNEKRNSDKIASEYKAMYEKLKATTESANSIEPFKKISSLSISPVTTRTEATKTQSHSLLHSQSPLRPLPNSKGSKIPLPSPSRNFLSSSSMNLSMQTSTPSVDFSNSTPDQGQHPEEEEEEEDSMVIDSPSRNAPLTLKDQDLNMVTTNVASNNTTVNNSINTSLQSTLKGKKILKRKFRKIASGDTPKKLKDDIYDDEEDDDDKEDEGNNDNTAREDFDSKINGNKDEEVDGSNLDIQEQDDNQIKESILTKKITAKKVKRNVRQKKVLNSSFGFPQSEGSSSSFISPLKSRNNSLKKSIFK